APCCRSNALVRLNGREPKKPFRAESGLGCTDSTHGTEPSSGLSLRALLPHRIATNGLFRSTSATMARSVISSQPLPWWEFGLPGCTVSALLSSSTPCSAHGVRSPLDGSGYPRSSQYSRKMLTRLLGSGRTSGATAKDNPIG